MNNNNSRPRYITLKERLDEAFNQNVDLNESNNNDEIRKFLDEYASKYLTPINKLWYEACSILHKSLDSAYGGLTIQSVNFVNWMLSNNKIKQKDIDMRTDAVSDFDHMIIEPLRMYLINLNNVIRSCELGEEVYNIYVKKFEKDAQETIKGFDRYISKFKNAL